MQRFKRWLLTLLIGGFVLVASYVLFAVIFTEFTVNMWWFRNLGFENYFWLRLGYRYLVFTIFTVLFFLIFFLNFWIGSRYLGTTAPPPSTEQATSRYRELVTAVSHRLQAGLCTFQPGPGRAGSLAAL